MLAKLMMVKSFEHDQIGLDRICCLFGRYFQVRDDYQNLASEEVSKFSGSCPNKSVAHCRIV
jgi:geranylgeranyl pyrophosphate synthase